MSNKVQLKACPLLPQSDTCPSATIPGEAHSRTYFLRCLGIKCAAFRHGYCQKLHSSVVLPAEEGEA